MTMQSDIAGQVRRLHHLIPAPSKREINAACDLYEHWAARGLSPNTIADLVGWTRGTCCVVRRWSIERAAGEAVRG